MKERDMFTQLWAKIDYYKAQADACKKIPYNSLEDFYICYDYYMMMSRRAEQEYLNLLMNL